MKLKTNLHLHTNDDPLENLGYSFYEAINRAMSLGFEVIGLTCHKEVISRPEYRTYAEERGILLIEGAELTIRRKHVVILNAKPDIKAIDSFETLRSYKREHPEIFVLAPHPYYLYNSLGSKLEKNIDLFDAVELSWFYSKRLNLNRKAIAVAKRHNLPLITTSDTHNLRFLNSSYATVNARKKTPEAIFDAIRAGSMQNMSTPSHLWREMIPTILKQFL